MVLSQNSFPNNTRNRQVAQHSHYTCAMIEPGKHTDFLSIRIIAHHYGVRHFGVILVLRLGRESYRVRGR